MIDKTILITGGSSGIGKSAAIALHKQGASIILQARDTGKLESAAREIDPSGNRISFYSTDLTDQGSVEATAGEIIDKHGLPDVIINCAGSGEWLSFKEADVAHYLNTMNSPYLATALTCKVFFDRMQERGTGHFIIVNSVAAYFSFPGATGYTPARWAMMGFARSLQADLFHTRFRVSLVTLGKVSSAYFKSNPRSEERIPRISNLLTATLSEKHAGKVVAKTVSTRNAVVIRPYSMAYFVFINRFFPGVLRWLMRRTGYKS